MKQSVIFALRWLIFAGQVTYIETYICNRLDMPSGLHVEFAIAGYSSHRKITKYLAVI